VWDEEYIDGDIISLNFNGKWVLKEYRLEADKKEIVLKVDESSDNYLVLYAHNEGKRPPNTAAVEIHTDAGTRKLRLSSSLKNCDSINIKLKEE